MNIRNRKLATCMAAALGLGMISVTASAQNPAEQADDTWISLTGTVTSTSEAAFKLDHGDGVITVEMDDWDSYTKIFPLVDGDQVTVRGKVDNDWYERATIEAASVYVKDLNSFFYASPADEEELGPWVIDVDAELGDLTYVGTVKSVSPLTKSFTIDTGTTELTVRTSELLYDPLDDEGFQKIEVGDRVSVHGDVDIDYVTNSDLHAESIVTLSD